ncbi:MAG: alpha/beta fold hydrolase [Gaiella sp.]
MSVNVLGIPVHHVVEGEQAGHPLLILHGWPADHRLPHHYLEPILAPRSAPGWLRVYPDLPGMGRTPGADWIQSQEDMLEVVLRFVDAVLGGRRFALAGVSYGGYLALAIAQRRAARLTGLFLWTPATTMDQEKIVAPPQRALVRDPAALAQLQPDEQLWPTVAVIQTPETLAAFRAAVKPGLSIADHEFLARFDARPDFSSDPTVFSEPIEVPTLILAGRQDVQTGYAGAVQMLEAFPRATLAVLDRAGHAAAVEQRTLFRALVDEWLNRVEEG